MHHPTDVPNLPDLVDLVSRGGACVLSGAGISTESGIPDYRGPDGTRRVKPMEYGEFVATSAARQRYWARAYVGWDRFRAARPNAGHRVVAALQRHGYVRDVITQNVDGLHQTAGTTDVLELHGTLSVVRCLTCEDRTSRDELQARLAQANPGYGGAHHDGQVQPDGDVALPEDAVRAFRLPRCARCGADTLKPDVVYFGESVPKDRVERAYAAVDASRLLLVLGSSLQVMSGYRFVRHAHKHGIPVAIVTRGHTRGDAEASLQLDAALGPTLVALAAALGIHEDIGPVTDGADATGLPLGLV